MVSETNSLDSNETRVSLLGLQSLETDKDKVKRRPYCVDVTVILVLLIISLSFALVLAFADCFHSLRCDISDTFKVQIIKCAPAENVSSIGNHTTLRHIALQQRNVSCDAGNNTNTHDCNTTASMSEQDIAYHMQAEQTWNIAWEVLHDNDNWHLETGSSVESGRVYSKTYKDIGRVFKLQGVVNCSPEQLFQIMVKNTSDLPSWNPTVKRSQILDRLSSDTDIHYLVTNPIAGGIISSRDYVNLRHWKTYNNVTMQAGVSTKYPSKPPTDDLIRGKNRPGGVIFRPVNGDKNRCLMEWAVSMEIGGWIPQWIVDNAMASTLMDFLKHCRNRAQRSSSS